MNYNSPALLHPSKVSALLTESVVPAVTTPEVPSDTNYQMPLFELPEEAQANYDSRDKKGSASAHAEAGNHSDKEKHTAHFPLLLEFARFQELFRALILSSDPNTFFLTRTLRTSRGIDARNPISSHLKMLIAMRKIRPRMYSKWTYTMLQLPQKQLIHSV